MSSRRQRSVQMHLLLNVYAIGLTHFAYIHNYMVKPLDVLRMQLELDAPLPRLTAHALLVAYTFSRLLIS